MASVHDLLARLKPLKGWAQATGLIFALLMVLLYPGWMGMDSLDQFNQAVTGQFNDWHSPFITALWRFILSRTQDHAAIFTLQSLVLAMALGGVITQLFVRAPMRWLVCLAVIFTPPLFLRLGITGKDPFALGLFLAAAACAMCARSQGRPYRRAWQVVGAGLLVMAAASRHEMALIAAPIVVLAAWPDICRLRSHLVRCAAAALSVPVSVLTLITATSALETVIGLRFDVEERHAIQQHRLHDLAALSIARNELLIPDAFLSDETVTLADIDARYSSYLSDFLMMSPTPTPLVRRTDPESLKALRSAWLSAVVRHPDLYLQHRTNSYLSALGLNKTHTWPPAPRYNPNAIQRLADHHGGQFGIDQDRLFRPHPLLASLHHAPPITRKLTLWDPAWSVLGIALCLPFLLVAALARSAPGPYRFAAQALLALCLCVGLHSVVIAMFGPGYVPRYFMLTQTVSVISLIWVAHASLTAWAHGAGALWQARFPFRRVWKHSGVRYVVVGASLAVLYVGLSSLALNLFPAWPAWQVSAFCLLITIGIQYITHAGITFQSKLNDLKQGRRFLLVTASGLTVSTLMTTFGVQLTGWSPVFLIILTSLAIPVVNYALFRLWVFTSRH